TSNSRPSMPFAVNGMPPVPGAPFANPCPTGSPLRTYRATTFDMRLVVNKSGWHDPQGRITVLDQDLEATLSGQRPAEPLFIRGNSGDCIVLYHSNKTARELHEDAFQVQTPTDTLGMHIHLVKFDVMAADGAGNGWNYEDGTYSHEEIHDRLLAMGFPNGHPNRTGTGTVQTTTQRWWADPLLNGSGEDRTIRTVFLHDHFGPSSIQQHGCYSALVIEPAGSTWWDPESGVQFGTRADGGPTSWRADIRAGTNGIDSFREFCIAIADYAILYDEAGNPVNPPRDETGEITPEAVSSVDPGTMVMNYRNEPVPLRIGQPVSNGSHNIRSLKSGDAGRIPYLFSSAIHGDPLTPIMRMYQGDKFQIRIVQGSHEDSHAFKINRSKWLRDPAVPNSGYINGQHTGISEHFEFASEGLAQAPFPVKVGRVNYPNPTTAVDMLWSDASEDGIWNGVWGLLRVFGGTNAIDPVTSQRTTLRPLPNNPQGISASNAADFSWPCPKTAPVRTYNVSAVTAQQAIGPNGIVYNQSENLFDNTGLMYVRTEDLDASGRLLPGVPVEPLVLRANAGDCLKVNLTNRLPSTRTAVPDNPSTDAKMTDLTRLNVYNLITDNLVGFTVDLVYTDANADGSLIGRNASSLVAPGASRVFTYYCGEITHNRSTNRMVATPKAYGTCSIRSWGDAIKQGPQGLFGALVVQPQGSTWTHPVTGAPAPTGTRAIITQSTDTSLPTRFREFVLMQQSGINLQNDTVGNAVPEVADDPEDVGEKAYNYRTEPFWARLGNTFIEPDEMNNMDLSNVLSGAVETPVFTVPVGERVVFRMTKAVGRARAGTFAIHGHRWLDMPQNSLSATMGQQTTNTVGSNWNFVLLDGAGGPNGVRGDFLFREVSSFQFSQGLWGILRVQ
ncbi:MAG: hypothetical protein RL148_3188, partial [Planctomycetota bacterium]